MDLSLMPSPYITPLEEDGESEMLIPIVRLSCSHGNPHFHC